MFAAAAALLIGVVVMGLLWLFFADRARSPDGVSSQPLVAVAPLPAPTGVSKPVAPLPGEPASVPTPAANPAAPLCGPGLEASGAAAVPAQTGHDMKPGPPSVQETDRALTQMEGVSAVHALAAAALRASLQVEQDFNGGTGKPPPCERSDEACRLKALGRYQDLLHAAHARAATEGRDLALRSGEPAAYPLALHLCSAVPAPQRPACTEPLLRAWTVREADNATPWLMLAAAEREQGDHQAADEALYRASLAPRISDGSRALWGVLGEKAFSPEAGAVAAGLQPRWAALIAGMNYASLGNLSGLCSDAVLRDGNLHQRCDAIAQRMMSQGGSLIHRVEGLAIAHRLGWPDDRLASLRAQVSALLEQDSTELAAQAALSPCDAVSAVRERAQQVAAQGEVARLEESLRGGARQSRSP